MIFLKGVLIGLVFGVPIGSIGALTIQRTLNYGMKAGLYTGFGSSVADCIYAAIGAFGLVFISDYFLKFKNLICVIGGLLLIGMGFSNLLRKETCSSSDSSGTSKLKLFGVSFILGITNPAAIFTFLLGFSLLGITDALSIIHGLSLIIGVFCGTYIWWILVSFITNNYRKRRANLNIKKVNRTFGTVLIVFGAIVLLQVFKVRII